MSTHGPRCPIGVHASMDLRDSLRDLHFSLREEHEAPDDRTACHKDRKSVLEGKRKHLLVMGMDHGMLPAIPMDGSDKEQGVRQGEGMRQLSGQCEGLLDFLKSLIGVSQVP